MDYLIAIYTGKKIFTLTLKPGHTATVGASQTDTIVIEKFGLSDSHLTFACDSGGVRILSKQPMKINGEKASNRVFSAGDVAVITEKISLAVFESKNRISAVLDLQDFDEIRLGRSFNNNDISLKHPDVSSSHAVLKHESNGWVIADVGSRNGTFVKGELIPVNSYVPAENANIFIGGFVFYIQNNNLRFSNTPGEVEFSPDVVPSLIQTSSGQKKYPNFQKSPRIRIRTEKTDFEIMSPPNAGNKPQISWISVVLPPCMMVLVMGFVALMMKNVTMLMYSAPMSLMSVMVSVINNKTNVKKWQKTSGLALKKYSEHLEERENDIIKSEGDYISALSTASPGVVECISIAENVSRRLWERTPKDSDFMNVRVGTGQINSNVTVKIPRSQLQIEENVCIQQAQELEARHKILTGIPVCHSFLSSPITGLAGRPDAVKRTAWRIIIDIATHHSYNDVKIVCIYSESEKKDWEWIRWLPHVWDTMRTKRYIACNPEDSKKMLREIAEILKKRRGEVNVNDLRKDFVPKIPFYFLLIADSELLEASGEEFLPETAALGFSVLFAYNDISSLPQECQSVINCDSPASIENTQPEAKIRNISFIPDNVKLEQLDEFACAFAPIRLIQSGKGDKFPKSISFLQGFNVKTVKELDILSRWNNSVSYKNLSVPIGVKSNGDLFYFNMFDGVMGPHGMTAGTAGSGKSEMLTTLILSMAATFSPKDLNLALIEFKGNDLSNILKPLPHIAGVVSNLNDPSVIVRSLRSLDGELKRRQQLFERASFLATKKVAAYQEYAENNGLPEGFEPLPYLIIIIDEFAQFITQFPEFGEDIIRIAQVGRSLGMYMILTMQSPQGVIKGQVAANLTFRVCLRTANPGESKEILGTNDAFAISAPGRAIVQCVGNVKVYEEVQTFYAKAKYNPNPVKKRTTTEINIVSLNGERTRPKIYDKTVKATRDALSEGNAVVNNIIEIAKENNIPWAKPVWKDPLPETLSLNELIKDEKAFNNGEWTQKNTGLSLTIGLVDAPKNQDQYPFVLDFVRDGHQVLYGAPSSGKTVFLQTVIMSLALSYTPEQANFIVVDYGSWGVFENLPHCLGIIDPGEKEAIRRVKDFITNTMASRKNLFASESVGTLEAYKEITGKSMPIILILVDNMASVNAQSPDFVDLLIQLAREGGSYGIYLILTSGTTGSFMMRIAQSIKSKHSLQMTDKGEYRTILGASTKVDPPGQYPGRGLTTSAALEFQTAFCVDGATEKERVKNLRDLCILLGESWKGKKPSLDAAEEEEPIEIEVNQLTSSKDGVQIGVNKTNRKPVEFIFNDMNGCVITGEDGCGKSNILGFIAKALGKDSKTQLYIFEEKTFIEKLCPNAKTVHDAKGADEIVAEVAKEFDKRNDESEGRIVFCIDNFAIFYSFISQESANILDTIASGGADRGIYIYTACDRAGLAKMSIFRIKLFENLLVNGNAIVTGGNLRDYNALSSIHRSDNIVFAKYEGCLIHNNKVTVMKFAQLEGA